MGVRISPLFEKFVYGLVIRLFAYNSDGGWGWGGIALMIRQYIREVSNSIYFQMKNATVLLTVIFL